MTTPRFSPATLDALERWYEVVSANGITSMSGEYHSALLANAIDADRERAMRAAEDAALADQRVPQPHRFGGVL